MQRDASLYPLPIPGPIPPRAFKEMVRQEWNAVADNWGNDRFWKIVEESAQVCNERLLDLARLRPGDRVLDVGTGIGEPAVSAARRVGPDGRVLGIDLAPRMIQVGRERVRRLGLEQVELAVGDAESLDLAPESFDAVLSRWTLMLVEDLGQAFAELRQLLVPGGRLAVCLWGHPQRVPMISAALRAAGELFPLPELPPDGPQHLWLRGLEVLGDLARETGYEEVRTEVVEATFRFDDALAYSDFIHRMAGPLHVLQSEAPEELGQRLRRRVAEAAGPFVQPDGSVEFVNETLLVAATRPRA